MLERFTAFLVKRRNWLAATTLLLLGLCSLGLPKLHFENDYRMFFSPDNPELKAFDDLQNKFAKTDNVLIVLKPRQGDLFTAERLSVLEKLTRDAWRLPSARRVDSPANFQHSAAVGDELNVAAVLEHSENLDAAGIAARRAVLLGEPMLVGRLMSADGTTAGVAVSLAMDAARKDEQVLEVSAAARQLAADVMLAHPDMEVRLTGSAMLDTAFHDAAQADGQVLIPAMFTVSLLLCWWLMRSLALSLLVGTVIACSIMAALGIAGLLGVPLSPTAVAAPNIIMTMAVADSIHFLVAWQNQVAKGETREQAMRNVLQSHLTLVAFTTAATVVSFLTMNTSDAPPFRDLGNITAIGVVAALWISLTLLPAIAIAVPVRFVGRPRDLVPRGLDALLKWIMRKPRTIAIVGLGGALLFAQLLWLNKLDDEYVKYFDTSLTFRQDTDWVEKNLTGIYELEYMLPSGKPDGVYDPTYLNQVDAFAVWLRAQPEVSHVSSLADVLRKLNKNFNGDDPAHFRIPETRALATQYFLAYELALPQGMDVSDQVDISRSALRMTASLRNISSEQIRAVEARARTWLDTNAHETMHVAATGPSLMFANIGERNISSMISGEVAGMVVVGLLLGLGLRSLRLGILSLVPTILPAAVAFGVWGVFVGQVGLASSVVAAMTLGILSDDTVHFLGHYRGSLRKQGDRTVAVEHAFHEAGQALWITTLVLVSGFGILALSHFRINAHLGILTVVILILGLLADFVLLPALLLFGVKKK
ncbi:hypothetical protein os1_35240 [Comamonadaceae bacterium OS-1]|nr:hypothetical protein os1_35240 [Comamonadaceae bacterium OS-1]